MKNESGRTGHTPEPPTLAQFFSESYWKTRAECAESELKESRETNRELQHSLALESGKNSWYTYFEATAQLYGEEAVARKAAESELAAAMNEAVQCDDIKLDQPLFGIIADVQVDREWLRAQMESWQERAIGAESEVKRVREVLRKFVGAIKVLMSWVPICSVGSSGYAYRRDVEKAVTQAESLLGDPPEEK